MATAPQHSNNTLLWAILIALGFLFGKTCNCERKHTVTNEYRVAYPARPDTVVTIVKPAEKVIITAKPSAGRTYYVGPRGGCYYISASGTKVYVARSMCDQ